MTQLSAEELRLRCVEAVVSLANNAEVATRKGYIDSDTLLEVAEPLYYWILTGNRQETSSA